jgi:hypothetical protein
MWPLTTLPHGSIPLDDQHPGRVDAGEVGSTRGDDSVEASFGALEDVRSPFAGALSLGRVRLQDDDLPAGELERPRVDAGKPELEHATRAVSQQLEDPRRGRGGESRGQARHGQTLTFAYRGASRRG